MSTKIGSLWLKTQKDGTPYFSGILNDLKRDIPVVLFKNTKKDPNSKQPDYLVYRSEPQEQAENVDFSEQTAPVTPPPTTTGEAPPQTAPDQEISFEKIPF